MSVNRTVARIRSPDSSGLTPKMRALGELDRVPAVADRPRHRGRAGSRTRRRRRCRAPCRRPSRRGARRRSRSQRGGSGRSGVPTIGATSFDQRQPGSKMNRPRAVSSSSTSSIRPLLKRRTWSGVEKLLRCRRGMAALCRFVPLLAPPSAPPQRPRGYTRGDEDRPRPRASRAGRRTVAPCRGAGSAGPDGAASRGVAGPRDRPAPPRGGDPRARPQLGAVPGADPDARRPPRGGAPDRRARGDRRGLPAPRRGRRRGARPGRPGLRAAGPAPAEPARLLRVRGTRRVDVGSSRWRDPRGLVPAAGVLLLERVRDPRAGRAGVGAARQRRARLRARGLRRRRHAGPRPRRRSARRRRSAATASSTTGRPATSSATRRPSGSGRPRARTSRRRSGRGS